MEDALSSFLSLSISFKAQNRRKQLKIEHEKKRQKDISFKVQKEIYTETQYFYQNPENRKETYIHVMRLDIKIQTLISTSQL
jgi:hypothetical protein